VWYDSQNGFQEPEVVHVTLNFSVPGVHAQAAEDDVSRELQFSSPSEAVV
jgi:hypothetical protein